MARSASRSEAAERDPPTIGPDPDRDHKLVTLLWRGSDETLHVLVHGAFWFDDGWNHFSAVVMRLIPGTDVWYSTNVISPEAQFEYRPEENERLLHPADDSDRESGYYDRFIPDPFNPNCLFLEPNDRTRPEDFRDHSCRPPSPKKAGSRGPVRLRFPDCVRAPGRGRPRPKGRESRALPGFR